MKIREENAKNSYVGNIHGLFARDYALEKKSPALKPENAVLAIHVSKQQLERSYRIFETFYKVITAFNGEVSVEEPYRDSEDNIFVKLLHCAFTASIEEKLQKRRDALTNAVTSMRPDYEKIPSGKLIFSIRFSPEKTKSNWCNVPYLNYKDEIIIEEKETGSLEMQFVDLIKQIREITIRIDDEIIAYQKEVEKKEKERRIKEKEEEQERENAEAISYQNSLRGKSLYSSRTLLHHSLTLILLKQLWPKNWMQYVG